MSEWTPEARTEYARLFVCHDIAAAHTKVRAALDGLAKADWEGVPGLKRDLEEASRRLLRAHGVAEARYGSD